MIVDMKTGKPTNGDGVMISPEDFSNLKSWIIAVNNYMEGTNKAIISMRQRIETLENNRKPRWWI